MPRRRQSPVPRLPRGLRAFEVARGRRYPDWPESLGPAPLTASELTPRARARLLARAERRERRRRAPEAWAHGQWYWIAAELALGLPLASPRVVRQWREHLKVAIMHRRSELDQLIRLEAAILAYEPETDRWLRRELNELTVPAPGRPRPDRPEETGGTTTAPGRRSSPTRRFDAREKWTTYARQE